MSGGDHRRRGVWVIERRRSPRVALAATAMVLPDDSLERLSFEVRNVSLGGALLEAEAVLGIDEPLIVAIRFAGDAQPFVATARVLRADYEIGNGGLGKVRIAVKFLQMTPRSTARLLRAIRGALGAARATTRPASPNAIRLPRAARTPSVQSN
jgi:c-di-GMP-binding flagellar brake protein YcgR